MDEKRVVSKYLEYRENVLKYTNTDMNLKLENDEQVYIAVFDIPTEMYAGLRQKVSENPVASIL